jgi:CRISPR-associated protein Csm4
MREQYTDYTIQIRLQSPIITPFQSDTIFGHICWAIRFLPWKEEKEDRLAAFLTRFDTEGGPPLLVSDGFPKGYLPKPILLPIKHEALEEIMGRENRIGNSFRIKTIKRMPLLPKETFKALQMNMMTPAAIFRASKDSYENIDQLKTGQETVMVQHNTVNRISGRVEAGLYTQEETFFREENARYDVYLRTNYFNPEELIRIFRFIGEGGFGRDKSNGKGQFTVEVEEGTDIPESSQPNAFMTLSSYMPSKNDPTRGHYSLIHKFGKLGGLYAKATPEVYGNPFKVPLIMFSAGSTFYDPDYVPGKTYGSLLENVHKNPDIRHYGYAFPVGIRIED